MKNRQFWVGVCCGVAALAVWNQADAFRGASADEPASAEEKDDAAAEPLLYELRTYTTPDGKLDALHARFRDHTMGLFEKHGMKNIMYWTPTNQDNTLIYVIAHKDMDAARASWQAFISDPEWKKVAAESQKDGKLVSKVESVYMKATDYSP